jgi:hypothetical protein
VARRGLADHQGLLQPGLADPDQATELIADHLPSDWRAGTARVVAGHGRVQRLLAPRRLVGRAPRRRADRQRRAAPRSDPTSAAAWPRLIGSPRGAPKNVVPRGPSGESPRPPPHQGRAPVPGIGCRIVPRGRFPLLCWAASGSRGSRRGGSPEAEEELVRSQHCGGNWCRSRSATAAAETPMANLAATGETAEGSRSSG